MVSSGAKAERLYPQIVKFKFCACNPLNSYWLYGAVLSLYAPQINVPCLCLESTFKGDTLRLPCDLLLALSLYFGKIPQ